MKIAIPVETKQSNAPVCVSFGRTPFFAIYDTDLKNFEFKSNSAADSQGGAGIKAAQLIADLGVNIVITYRCGENAAQVLKPANIKIYKAQDGSIKENVEKFISGQLSELNEIHEGFHNHGGAKQ